jgi:predicted nucleotidyltransferase
MLALKSMSDSFPVQNADGELDLQMVCVEASTPLPIVEYLDAVRQTADKRRRDIVSIWIFGSASIGGFSSEVSDVDLMIVLADDVTQDVKLEMKCEFEALELRHGLRQCPKDGVEHLISALDQKIGGFKSLTFCYKRDLMAGEVSAVFEANALAKFINGSTHLFCFASIIKSAQTIWGEELIAQIPNPAITKEHFLKNLLAHLLRNACALLGYPILPNGTKYSMAILKGFIHDCYFISKAKGAHIEEEINFLRTKIGESKVLTQLLTLRENYRPSPGFIIRCFRELIRLYAAILRENAFPVTVARPDAFHHSTQV